MAGSIIDAARQALAGEPHIDLAHHPIGFDYDGRALVLEGELDSLAAKKLALQRAAAVPGVSGVVDRLRVAPAEPMADGRLCRLLADALVEENAFADLAITATNDGRPAETIRIPIDPMGRIDVTVENGVVRLTGRVPGLDYKRLAGVLAWWIPGSRDVVNHIAVQPPEADSDEMLTDAVRLALEKDPFVDAAGIGVAARDGEVTLTGLAAGAAQAAMAENDAWYVFAVERVINRIRVRS